jgi:tetratricopeptide (TPR) repeat protein
MAKKIKHKREQTEEERKAEEAEKAAEAARAAVGIQDEFQARGFELVHWMQEHQKLVLSILGVVIVSGLAYGVAAAIGASRNTDASIALAEALDAWEAPIGEEADPSSPKDGPRFADAAARTKAARDLFVKAADGHKGTGAGAIAQLYAGHAAMKLDEHDEAARRYRSFLDEVSKKDPLRYAGLSGLAHALEAKGDKAGAVAQLEALVDLPGSIEEDAALLDLGRLHAELGAPDKARSALTRLTKDFPESSLVGRAEERLAALPSAPAEAPVEAGGAGAGKPETP